MEPAILDCPVCGEATEHRLLKATQQTVTAACSECGEVRSMSPPRVRTHELKLIVSHESEARADRLIVDPDEEIAVGDEFDHDDHRMIVTGLEFTEGKADKAKARDIHVLHAKVFDNVVLKVSVNENDITRSYRVEVRPEAFYQIGEVIKVDDRKLLIKTIKSDQNRTLHRGGLIARHIVRVFCDPASPGARVGEVGVSRMRGRLASAPSKKGGKVVREKPTARSARSKPAAGKATGKPPARAGKPPARAGAKPATRAGSRKGPRTRNARDVPRGSRGGPRGPR